MKNKLSLFLFCSLLLSNISLASLPKGFFIDAYLGRNIQNFTTLDFSGGFRLPVKKTSFEGKVVYTYDNFKTHFLNVSSLEFFSHGLGINVNFYPFKGLYIGVGYITKLSWATPESKISFKEQSVKEAPEFFIGNLLSSQIGYRHFIKKKLSVNFQLLAGFHSYEIEEGWQLGSDDGIEEPSWAKEQHLDLLMNISVGLSYHLSKIKE
jgi:hypothetical protein